MNYFDYALESVTDNYIAYEGQTAKSIAVDARMMFGREGREYSKHLYRGYNAELHKDYKTAIIEYSQAKEISNKLIHEIVTYPGDIPDTVCGTLLAIIAHGSIMGLIGDEIGSAINNALFYVKDRKEIDNYNPIARDALNTLHMQKWWMNRRITKCKYKMQHKSKK